MKIIKEGAAKDAPFLCPKYGNFTINGVAGTNVWAIPKDPTLPDPTDSTKTIMNPVFNSNFMDVYLVSKYFDIKEYNSGTLRVGKQ